MKKNKVEEWFKGLYCADAFILKDKKCGFYWWEKDYWGECDEGCHLCGKGCKTRILCYLPYRIQKLILNIMEHKEEERIEKLINKGEYNEEQDY